MYKGWLLALLLGLTGVAQAAVDPTRPAGAATVRAGGSDAIRPALKLQAIRSQDGRRSAVINGRTLVVGDRIGGARVTAIDAGGVTLSRDGSRERLRLGGGLTKQWQK